MIKRWIYYTGLALKDLTRLWASTQHHVIIVAGIFLPILLLVGLQQGHVAKLREDLLTSPTGRQIIFWSAQNGDLLNRSSMTTLARKLPKVDLIIPETQRLVTLQVQSGPDAAIQTAALTLYSTCPGDPMLAQAGCDVLEADERAVIVSRKVAESLGVTTGDRAQLIVEREQLGIRESAALDVSIKAVAAFGSERQSIGYADTTLLVWLEQYVGGYGVAKRDWPALSAPGRDKYAAYLAFCERTNDLTPEDREMLAERGLLLQELPDDVRQWLRQVMVATAFDKLNIYLLASQRSLTDVSRRLSLSPSDISEPLESDCVIVPWNPPHLAASDRGAVQLVGLSMPKHIWLRPYFQDPALSFDYEAETFQGHLLNASEEGAATITVHLGEASEFDLQVVACEMPATPAQKPDTLSVEETREPQVTTVGESPAGTEVAPQSVVVPANLVAYLDAFGNELCMYDSEVGLFVPVPTAPVYDKARLYASTIDAVPAIVAALTQRQFAVMSENSRIVEIHQQTESLQLLVLVVGLGVFLFGVVTVFSVLLDSTDRKRNAIGVLRVMGISQKGIFYVVILRAVLIGMLAGLASVVLGYLVAALLHAPLATDSWLANWKPTVSVVLAPQHVASIFLGALVCSAIGSLIPAWRASRMDPFDAVVEGRFH